MLGKMDVRGVRPEISIERSDEEFSSDAALPLSKSAFIFFCNWMNEAKQKVLGTAAEFCVWKNHLLPPFQRSSELFRARTLLTAALEAEFLYSVNSMLRPKS